MATFLTPKLLLQAISLVCYFIYLFLNHGARMAESFRLIYRPHVTPCWLVSFVCCFKAESRLPPSPPRFFSCTVLEAGLWLVLGLVLAVVRDVLESKIIYSFSAQTLVV